jgi:IS66 Orf2 like protein
MPVALAPGTKVYLALAPVDMRKGYDGLAALVQQVLQGDPFCGHSVFVSIQKSRPVEAVVVGRQRAVSVCQAAGAGTIRLDAGRGGRDHAHACADC